MYQANCQRPAQHIGAGKEHSFTKRQVYKVNGSNHISPCDGNDKLKVSVLGSKTASKGLVPNQYDMLIQIKRTLKIVVNYYSKSVKQSGIVP